MSFARHASVVVARLGALVVATLLLTGIAVGVASAAPAARIDHIIFRTDRWLQVFVDSPAMGRIVQVDLLLPANRGAPHPSVYMLEGVYPAVPDENDWTRLGGAVQFFANKNVNVILPVGAPGSYYTDWSQDDPRLGRQKWETLLTREIPPLFDARFNGNGLNGIVGLSMGAQSAVMLAERSGSLFRSVGAYSGCYNTVDLFGQAQIRYATGQFAGNTDAMWGPINDPDWTAHDTFANAGGLAGKTVYISSGSGIPGGHDTFDNPNLLPSVFIGGPLEAFAQTCMSSFAGHLSAIGVPATIVHSPTGTHSWPYWHDQLAASWPTIARGLGTY